MFDQAAVAFTYTPDAGFRGNSSYSVMMCGQSGCFDPKLLKVYVGE